MTGITINNTSKSGWIHLELNDYYNGYNGDNVHYSRLDDISGVCLGMMDGMAYVELHMEHEKNSFYLTHTTSTHSTIKQCSTINGVAPSSITDLRDKILALL